VGRKRRNMSAVNFYLEDRAVELLDQLAEVLGVTRSEALRQTIGAGAALLKAATRQSIARLEALRSEFKDDAVLTVFVVAGEDGEPVPHALIDGQPQEGVRTVARRIGDQVFVFLNLPALGPFEPEVFVNFANTGVFAPDVSLPLGALPWPPDPTRAFVVRLGDLDQIIQAEPMLREPIEA
jgi:Ribbon-helix-helix protein, copG family